MKTYNKIYTVHAWKDNNKFFTVVQGEGGVKYPRLKIIDDNGSIDLTGVSITYTATLPRGSEEIVDATIIDAKQGIVEFEIKSSMTMCSGIAYGELNIVSDSKVLKVGGINLTISSATNGHEIEASEQFSALVEALRKVVTLTPEGTAVIPDGNITTEKLADNAITSNKIANNAITAEKLADTVLANKANKATTLAGYGITDGIKDAAGTVRAVNLAADVINKFGEKVDSSELFDVTKSINLANLADYSQHQNGVTITVSKNKISLSGTSMAATNFFLPLKSSITLRIDTPYCLSLQDFTTNNTGCVFYPAHGQTVIDSKWLLSEVSALKNAAATYTPTQDIVIDHIKIAIATDKLTTNSCYLQIEQNNQKTAYVDPEKIVQKVKIALYQAPDYTMHYLYVSNDYNENTEGFGETKFNSILSANNSISDNSYHNRYTIVVMAGTYTDLQDKYAGMSDVGLVGYRGVMTKDYVYYESENIYNPAATVIKWDGATGFDKSTLKSEDIIKKCPFHLDLNVHTHIKGFTFDCKNIRYGIHLESGGTGYATNWVVGHCTFIWGGRADCVDYA
uniref:BppU family phage baseplate upper protein n=1 Tax=Ruminococcus bromii TaxID=40518 RepID=UPI003A9180A3